MYKYYVYILTNRSRQSLYIWVTNNLHRRLYEHKNKLIPWFTSKYNCDRLIYVEETNNIEEAIKREKQLKWRTRDKKEKLIRDNNPNLEDIEI